MKRQQEFDISYKKYYAPLFVFAKRFVEDDDDCHDLLGDVFEDVWLHFSDIRPEALKSYLYVTLRRKCLDFLRHKKAEQHYIDLLKTLTANYDSAERILEMEEREKHVSKVINSLQPPTKEIFRLCFVDRLKYAEAAASLGISIATVKKHIVRALKILREQREKSG